MMIIRPVARPDQKSLLSLAGKAGSGLTTLPNDKQLLGEKITQSLNAFNATVTSPASEYYLFVLEDTDSGKIVGTSALAATIGLNEAFYTYHLGTVVHTSPELGIHNVINTLYLGNDFTGSTEICTLFLDPDFRREGNGQLLSRCRFLFMALHLERFSSRVMAEMRGVSDADGNSPFWDAIGKHFFSMKFSDADAISGEGKNRFIAELMPKYPIYLPFLPKTAQEVIGKVHPETKPALNMLEKEGFEYRGYVDIFDGGPSIEIKTHKIRTIRKSFNATVCIDSEMASSLMETPHEPSVTTQQYLLANTQVKTFRATYANLALDPLTDQDSEQKITINSSLAQRLRVQSGDRLRVYPTGR